MSSPISQGLAGVRQFAGTQLKERGPVDAVGPAHHEAPKGSTGIADSMRRFMQTGADAYQSVELTQQKRAEERSNEIITKLSPEQRRSAIADGTLLYQDDAHAMRALREKTGRNAAFEVDSEIQQKIKQGAFKTRKDLEDYRQVRLTDAAKAHAQDNGIIDSDESFQRGYNSNITQRNAALFDTFGQFQSSQYQTNAVLQSRSDIGAMLSDPSLMRGPSGPAALTGYINSALTTGDIPTTQAAVELLSSSLTDAAAREGGVGLLSRIGDQTINVNGQPIKVTDIVGAESLENLKAKAAHYEQSVNAERAEQFHTTLSNLVSQPDTVSALQGLDKLHSITLGQTPTDVMTPERQALMSARQTLLNRQRAETVKLQTDTLKKSQGVAKLQVLEQAWTSKLDGELVSTDPALLPTNEATGTFTREDEANYANLKMDQIQKMDLTPEEKTNLMLQYVKADRKDGPFRKVLTEFVDQAAAEWDGAVIAGSTQQDYPSMSKLRALVQSDPVSMAMLSPERADLMAKLNAMDRYGLDFATAVEAERANSKLTREERNAHAKDFTVMMRKSRSAAAFMPAEMNDMARTVYDAHIAITGSPKAAERSVEEFIKRNTVTFGQQGSSGALGAIFKTDLMLDPTDVESWKDGQTAIDKALKGFTEAHPEVGDGGAFVASRNGMLFIQTLNGRVQPIDMAELRTQHMDRKAAARVEAQRLADEKRAKEIKSIKRSQEGFKGYATP